MHLLISVPFTPSSTWHYWEESNGHNSYDDFVYFQIDVKLNTAVINLTQFLPDILFFLYFPSITNVHELLEMFILAKKKSVINFTE